MPDVQSPIRSLRIRYKLTQQGLSDLLGIPKRTIENWESGSRRPPDWIIDLITFAVENGFQK